MAEITVTGRGDWISKGVYRMSWPTFNSTGNGTQFEAPNLPDKTVTVYGTYVSGGGTILIQGSEVGGTGLWFTLNDPQGNALSIATGKVETILENPRYIRPRMSAQASTTSVNVVIIAQSTKR
jgi:hypothetical protein